MKRYVLRYLIFWLPAALVAYFFNNETLLSQILQWFFAFFMLFAWSVNTAMAACRNPRGTLSLLLAYGGIHALMLTAIYNADFRSGLYVVLRAVSGVFSFRPLGVFVHAVDPFNLYSELLVLSVIVVCCFAGFLFGAVRHRVCPDPYHPRIIRRP